MQTIANRDPRLTRFTFKLRVAMAMLGCAIIVQSVAPTTMSAQGRGGRGRNGLPGAFSKLPKGAVGEVSLLLTDVISYLGSKPPAMQVEPGNFFGRITLRPPSEDEEDSVPLVPGQFGLYVLGGLKSSEIRQLSDLARQQMTAVASWRSKYRQAFAKILELLQEERPNRALERELQAMGRELGVLEGELGLAQANAFLAINESMTDDQREYMLILRRSPDSGSLKNPSVAKIREQADRLDESLRLTVLSMAERCCLFLTGTADQNVPQLYRQQLTQEERDDAEQKLGMLEALNPVQQAGLATLLAEQLRMKQDSSIRRTQVAEKYDALKLKKHVDERRLAAPSGALGQSHLAATLSRLRGLHQFRETLSNAQRTFIANNILAP